MASDDVSFLESLQVLKEVFLLSYLLVVSSSSSVDVYITSIFSMISPPSHI